MRRSTRDRSGRIGAGAALLGGALSAAVVSAGAAAAAVTVNVPCSPAVPGGGPAGLIAAINHANAHGGGTIGLAPGCTYTLGPHGNNDENGLPVVTTPITIDGNGSTVARSHAPGTADFRIFEVDGPGRLTLSSLTVTGGKSHEGGGILDNSDAALTLDNSRVTGNSVVNDLPGGKAFGAGISSNNHSTLALNNSRVDHNVISGSSLGGGGGLYENNDSTSAVNTSRVDHNRVIGSMIAVGGGIAVDGGSGSRTMTLRGSQVDDNSVDATVTGELARGGGIESNGTAVTLDASRVTANSVNAPSGSAFGGGIHSLTSGNLRPVPDGLLTVGTSQVTGNGVSGRLAGGGGISNQVGAARIASSQVAGNTVTASNTGADGGGIENLLLPQQGAPRPTLTVTTTQVSDNTVSAAGQPACGGGLFNSGAATVTSAFVTGNRATGSPARGGGIFTAHTLPLVSSVVAGNVPDNLVDGTAASCTR